MATKPARSTSLTELGYTISESSGKDSKGNEIVFKAKGPAPVYFFKQTKRGRIIAVKDKESTVESTVEGLYNFKVQGNDLVGQRAESTPSSSKKTATESATQAA